MFTRSSSWIKIQCFIPSARLHKQGSFLGSACLAYVLPPVMIPLANPSSSDQGRRHAHNPCKHRGAGLSQWYFHEPGTHTHQVEGSPDKLMLQPSFREP